MENPGGRNGSNCINNPLECEWSKYSSQVRRDDKSRLGSRLSTRHPLYIEKLRLKAKGWRRKPCSMNTHQVKAGVAVFISHEDDFRTGPIIAGGGGYMPERGQHACSYNGASTYVKTFSG